MELKEKERKDFQENQKKKKKLEQEKKKEEYAKRLQQSKLTIEENLEKIPQVEVVEKSVEKNATCGS